MLRMPALAWLAMPLVLGGLGACDAPGGPPDAGTTAWRLGPPMPRRALEPGVTAFGQQVVVLGGFDTGAGEGLDITSRVDAFDAVDGVWTRLPDAPVRWTHANLATIGPTLYLLGGLEGTDLVARGDSFALDPVTHKWTPIAPLPPGTERGGAAVTTAPGRIYLIGGASSTAALASGLEYDVARDVWYDLPPLPEPRARAAATRTVDGRLIVAGGFATLDPSSARDDVWVLPPPAIADRTWSRATAMPDAPRGGCAYGFVLGTLVCAGGARDQRALTTVQGYDPYLDEWRTYEPMPVARAGTPGAAIGSRLFVPGGADTLSLEPTDTLYIFAPLDTAP